MTGGGGCRPLSRHTITSIFDPVPWASMPQDCWVWADCVLEAALAPGQCNP